MALNFFNMILEPFYAAFGNFNPDANFFQTAVIVCLVLGFIKLSFSFLIK